MRRKSTSNTFLVLREHIISFKCNTFCGQPINSLINVVDNEVE